RVRASPDAGAEAPASEVLADGEMRNGARGHLLCSRNRRAVSCTRPAGRDHRRCVPTTLRRTCARPRLSRQRRPEPLLMGRPNGVLMAFPALVFVLLLVSAFGSDLKLVVVAVALANAPRIARIVRAAALAVVDLPYVEAARARGERGMYVTVREILPNIKAP